jgi:hypothetical protein
MQFVELTQDTAFTLASPFVEIGAPHVEPSKVYEFSPWSKATQNVADAQPTTMSVVFGLVGFTFAVSVHLPFATAAALDADCPELADDGAGPAVVVVLFDEAPPPHPARRANATTAHLKRAPNTLPTLVPCRLQESVQD